MTLTKKIMKKVLIKNKIKKSTFVKLKHINDLGKKKKIKMIRIRRKKIILIGKLIVGQLAFMTSLLKVAIAYDVFCFRGR